MQYRSRDPKDGKLIYHLTAASNFPGILSKGLLSRNQISPNVDIADSEIITKRGELGLLDYVPFHFFAKNPFDGIVQKKIEGHDFIYITLWRTQARLMGAKILPIHPLVAESDQIYDFDKGIQEIDWATMALRNYADDHCKHICMAECLIKDVVPASEFAYIYTKDERTKKFVEWIINARKTDIPAKIQSFPNLFL